MTYSTLLDCYEQNLQQRHYFGYFGAMIQKVGTFELGQNLTIDMVNQTSRSFELSLENYQQLKTDFNQISLIQGQGLFIEVRVDNQDQLLGWKLIALPYTLEYATYLMQSCYRTDHLIELFSFIQKLASLELQSFLWSLLSRGDLAQKFVSIPASRQHHHAYPSGLLEHSLECMRIVKAGLEELPRISNRENELTQVAALLHDIGKTQTLRVNGDHTLEGFNINHEHYTLSLMVDELNQLKKVYEQAAVALEYMLTWKLTDGYPKFIGANLVKAADRMSTGAQLREQAFADLPQHYHFTQIQTGQQAVHLSRLN